MHETFLIMNENGQEKILKNVFIKELKNKKKEKRNTQSKRKASNFGGLMSGCASY